MEKKEFHTKWSGVLCWIVECVPNEHPNNPRRMYTFEQNCQSKVLQYTPQGPTLKAMSLVRS